VSAPAEAFREMPVIAILRGIAPQSCVSVAEVMYRAGIRIMEVPLNSPDPYTSIRLLSRHLASYCVIGAGTVLTAMEVQQAQEAGAQLVVSPNVDVEVIRQATELGLEAIPGIATATEAFVAIHAGATMLKLFPAATYGPTHLKALKAVLPPKVAIIPVGGVSSSDVESWSKAGAAGFGFGSELFKPTFSVSEIEQRAGEIVAAVKHFSGTGGERL
jgi:2-dehydro-3-deoxyphosphogalactonate aldolase